MGTALTVREQENLRALGGMRNPHLARQRLPKADQHGRAVQELLLKAQQLWPRLKEPARAILTGKQPEELPTDIVDHIRRTLLRTLFIAKERNA